MNRRTHIWSVGALTMALDDALQARFGAVTVQGEISGLTMAGSGHCYFALKDAQAQLRCAMFRRSVGMLDFTPREGDHVIVQGRVGLYTPRGELQLVVQAMRRAGQGNLHEQFLRLKQSLQAEGLFDTARKRPPRAVPRCIALITSPNAAALHDVVSTLRRRAPHVAVVLIPALVQGAQAPESLRDALKRAYALRTAIDTIVLVRGGGSIEDLWAFNDPALARLIVQSPVPLIAGIGHESDFTIADLCADVRAPTPTAAAELAASAQAQALGACEQLQDRLMQSMDLQLQWQNRRIDHAAAALARPSTLLVRHESQLARLEEKMHSAFASGLQRQQNNLAALTQRLKTGVHTHLDRQQQHLEHARLRMDMLNPQRVLERGYAILSTEEAHVVSDAQTVQPGQTLQARLAQGTLQVQVKVQKQGAARKARTAAKTRATRSTANTGEGKSQ